MDQIEPKVISSIPLLKRQLPQQDNALVLLPLQQKEAIQPKPKAILETESTQSGPYKTPEKLIKKPKKKFLRKPTILKNKSPPPLNKDISFLNDMYPSTKVLPS